MHISLRLVWAAAWAAVFVLAAEGRGFAAASGEVPVGAPQLPGGVTAPPYSLPDALADALSGPLQLVGKGAWHGLVGSLACAYRNDRVLVVDQYCRQRELRSLSVTIVSPLRGRVTISAEGKAPVSKLERRDYQSFSGRSEILDPRRRLSLDMSVEDLSQYHAFAGGAVPFCDLQLSGEQKRGGCIKPLTALYPAYEAENLGFITTPPASWFSFVRSLIELRRRLPAQMTAQNRFAWGEAHAYAEQILLYSYHMSAANNQEGLFAPVVAAQDGGLLLIGTKAPRPITLRMDRLGKVLWQRDLSIKGFAEFEGCSAVATADGGFILFVLSYIASNRGPRTRLVKLDGNGRVVWDFQGRGNGGLDTPVATSLKLTASGSVQLVGHVYVSASADPRAARKWQAEVDAQGKLLHEEVGDPLPPPGRAPAK